MTEHEQPDHWGALASDLGTKPTEQGIEESASAQPGRPEPPARPEPIEMRTRKPPRRPAAELRRPQPNWDVVASQLGMAPPEELTEAAPATPVLHTPSKFSETLTEVFPTPDDLRDEPGEIGGVSMVLVEERGLVEESPPPAAETTERKSLRRRRKRRRKDRPSREDEARESGAESETAEQLAAAETDEAIPPVAERRPGAAEQEQPRPKHRRQRRSSRRRREPSAEGEVAPAERAAGSPEDARLASRDELFEEPEEPEDSEDSEDFEDFEDSDTAAEPQPEGGEQARPARARDAAEERIGHRAIPTWEEAIGVIIAANLEARAKRPSGGAPRGRNDGRNARGPRGSARKPGGPRRD